MLERDFQASIIFKLKKMFPGCIVIKNDPLYIQGLPDLLVLFNDKWAALECKASKTAKKRPNQDYYISTMNKMSYASFIYPENEEEVLYELQRSFSS